MNQPLFKREITLGNLLIILSMIGSAGGFAMTQYHKVASLIESQPIQDTRIHNLEESQIKMQNAMTQLTTTVNDWILIRGPKP